VEQSAKEKIEPYSIHICPGENPAIGISRDFKDVLADIGCVKFDERAGTFYHDDIRADIAISGNTLCLFFYRNMGEKVEGTKLHNYLVTNIPRNYREEINRRFPTMVGVKVEEHHLLPPRQASTLYLEFDLNKAEVVGKSMPVVDDKLFGDD